MENGKLILHSVNKIALTQEPDTLILEVVITDFEGETYSCNYVSRASDTGGLNPTIRQWLADNPDFPRDPYVPPTVEEIRSQMPALTRREFRRGMLLLQIPSSAIDAAIAGIQDPNERELAEIDWQEASQFDRNHHLVTLLSQAFGLSQEAIDTAWMEVYGK